MTRRRASWIAGLTAPVAGWCRCAGAIIRLVRGAGEEGPAAGDVEHAHHVRGVVQASAPEPDNGALRQRIAVPIGAKLIRRPASFVRSRNVS